METKKPTILMILDGFGINTNAYGNAIAQANKPFIDELFKKYPNTTIGASGKDVGLPDGQMGNSEVGHLNIGAGRVVFQELTRITDEIERGAFYDNAVINEAIDHVKENDSNLHVFGLLSDGGVHSHIDHLKAILKLAADRGVTHLYVHCFWMGEMYHLDAQVCISRKSKRRWKNLVQAKLLQLAEDIMPWIGITDGKELRRHMMPSH